MKYIYYILGVLLVITLGLAIRLGGVKVEVSEPALVINDRVISKSELAEFEKVGSYHSRGEGFLDAVITRELLIQEALKQGIHKEEAFRKSIEDFYEQSLVKALVDRELQTLSPDVTKGMITKYKEMCLKTVKYTKIIYEDEEDFKNGKPLSSSHQEHDFEDLSETLKYSLFALGPGEGSRPERSNEGIVVFRLDKAVDTASPETMPDDDQIREFLIDQGKNAMFDSWLSEIRKKARIEVLVDQ